MKLLAAAITEEEKGKRRGWIGRVSEGGGGGFEI